MAAAGATGKSAGSDSAKCGALRCAGLCTGEAGWVWNCLCCPLVLFYNACAMYVCSCVGVLCERLRVCLCACMCACCGGPYLDPDFGGQAALGAYKGSDPFAKEIKDEDVDWVRAHELVPAADLEKNRTCIKACRRSTVMQLFQGKVEPADLCQGAVGDCWLVAAFASIAEHEVSPLAKSGE